MEILEEILVKLEEMEEAGKVDVSIVDNLNGLIKFCEDKEEEWVSNEEIETRDAFQLFHAARNSRLILNKMKKRFISAGKMHDNPKVVNDAIRILPAIRDICEILSSINEKYINPEILLFLSKKLRNLRNLASQVSMLPSLEEELSGLNKRKLRSRFNRIINNLQAKYIEMQGLG